MILVDIIQFEGLHTQQVVPTFLLDENRTVQEKADWFHQNVIMSLVDKPSRHYIYKPG